ncbi:MAG TPA: TolC family protein, partial [Polyangia bacterium]
RLDTETDATEREIDAEVARAHHALTANLQMVDTMERDVLPAAESAVDLITQGWRAGKFDLFRVIQASREASEARRNQLESLGALWQAAIAVDRATGTP